MAEAQATVFVPATLANLGSGFDSLGVALDLYLKTTTTVAAADSFFYSGDGALADSPDNLVHQGFRAAWRQASSDSVPKVRIVAENPVPLARGMGSSSAALVAGAMAADILLGGPLGPDRLFEITAALEGHPDNVGPAIYGGFVSAIAEPALAIKLPDPQDLLFVLGIPRYEVPTALARAALAKTLPLADAVYNLSRSALWVAALATGQLDALKYAAQDRLHQTQRAHLMPGLFSAIDLAYQNGALAAFVGGAGPTLAALCQVSKAPAVAADMANYVGDGKTITLKIGRGAWGERS